MNDHLRAKLCEWANYTASPMPHEAQKVCAEAATELETLHAALAASEAREKELHWCLFHLHATVMGECRSLLNEDSGGDAALAIRIEALLHPKQDKAP